MNQPHRVIPDLDTLARLFYADPESLGRFQEVEAADMPARVRKLLAHEHHMTVTVESHYKTAVDVGVLQTEITPQHYAREILLTLQTDGDPDQGDLKKGEPDQGEADQGDVVQYGIMRINFSFVDEQVRREIESQETPLGRILIEHDVLRRVHLFSLWKISPSRRLSGLLELADQAAVYGRTALIYCNDEPAIELLEIVK